MSNSPMHGVAGYPAAAEAWTTMDCAEIQRKREALQSYMDVLEEARRRLDETIQHDDAGAGAAADVFSDSDTAGGGDDFYPLEEDEDAELEEEQRPMQWQDQLCRQMVYNNSSGHLAADSNNNHDLDLDDVDGDDEISRDLVSLGLHVPHIQTGTATPPFIPEDESAAQGGRGFGAVPASAAAIASLSEQRYDGSGNDSMCVICMREYKKKSRRLRVMPCAYKHRFHGRCIKEWLSRSNLCPLCRHALPTAADAERGGGGGVRSRSRSTTRVRVRVNVNPY